MTQPAKEFDHRAAVIGQDNIVFAPGLGQKTAVDFSHGAAHNHALSADLSADHFNQIFGAGVPASIDVKSAFGMHTEATIDPLPGASMSPYAAAAMDFRKPSISACRL